jgi:hypothetical protein
VLHRNSAELRTNSAPLLFPGPPQSHPGDIPAAQALKYKGGIFFVAHPTNRGSPAVDLRQGYPGLATPLAGWERLFPDKNRWLQGLPFRKTTGFGNSCTHPGIFSAAPNGGQISLGK